MLNGLNLNIDTESFISIKKKDKKGIYKTLCCFLK